YGELIVSYQSVVSTGQGIVRDWDFFGAGLLNTRLNMNVIDVDFTSLENGFGSWWSMRWRIGVRTATVFYDTRVDGVFVGQKSAEHFAGAGPHAALELWRQLPWSGWSLYGKADGAFLIGRHPQASQGTFTPAS